ncbi:MAG: hypothetical protein KatS3mg129_0558 [Leptospiraceae bacterium]|nr:MAG: hypothetical protein KatS3mg129_0558 [Leptospiraceae bacterium]
MIFLIVYHIGFVILFLLPIFIIWLKENLEISYYFFYFLIYSLIISICFIFLSKKIYHQFNIKNILINFFILISLYNLFLFILNFFFPVILKEYFNYYFFYSISFSIIFYTGNLILFYISKIILQNRNRKILRKLTNYEDEIFNLYNFINDNSNPEFSFYQYQKLLQYVNSYIIEKNNEILCSINFIINNNTIFIFDFKAKTKNDFFSMMNFIIHNILNSQIKNIIYLTNIPEESNELLTYLNYSLNLQNKTYFWEKDLFNKDFLKQFEEKTSIYILKKFYNMISDKKNSEIYVFKKVTLQ